LSGLSEEENSPERNGYKVRAFKTAILAIEGLDRPLVDEKDAKKVCILATYFLELFNSLQVKGIGEGIARRIGVILAGSDPVSRL